MNASELESIAKCLADGGILAADESPKTNGERFSDHEIPTTEANRRDYRELLFTTPGLEQWISGVILHEETLGQESSDGTPFARLLAERGILPGVKVDRGARPLAGFGDERVTEGLDGLRDRLEGFQNRGARFAKWRAVIKIGNDIPSSTCVEANAHALARYAALCQEQGLVPIVEPEVLMQHGTHTIARCAEVTDNVLSSVFDHLVRHRVQLNAIILKPSMVLPGEKCSDQADARAVAEATLRCLSKNVPAAVPGIAFLSGGQTPQSATQHLQEMIALGPHPWPLSFSYSRALQNEAMAAWKGDPANVSAAQKAFARRLRLVNAARAGQYSDALEAAA
jgi:fructose-bisphosphate aldolase, class I